MRRAGGEQYGDDTAEAALTWKLSWVRRRRQKKRQQRVGSQSRRQMQHGRCYSQRLAWLCEQQQKEESAGEEKSDSRQLYAALCAG